jgi:hypothetical protein
MSLERVLRRLFAILWLVQRVWAQSLAIALAGLPRGTNETAVEFERAILRPMRASNISVDVFAAVHREDAHLWHTWFERATVREPTVVYIEDVVIAPAEQSYFSTCSNPGNIGSYHAQYSKLEVAWKAIERSSKAYDWVMKGRNDYVYHPRQAFKPCWLRELPENVILTTDKEPHRTARWNEYGRGKRVADFVPEVHFPVMTSDAMYTGRFAAMRRLLTIDSTPPLPANACLDPRLVHDLNGTKPCPDSTPMFQIEHRTADHVFRANIAIHSTSFQANNFNRGQGWLDTPCLICYDCANHQ